MNKKLKLYLEIPFIAICSFIFIYIGIFTHEIFHLFMMVYFGIDEASFYVDRNGGIVNFKWSKDNITLEEELILTLAGGLFNIILYLVIMLCLYSKRKSMGFIPIIRIMIEIYYWYNKGSDYQYFIKYHPNINITLVDNLFFGLLILSFIIMWFLMSLILFSMINEFKDLGE